MKRRFRLIPDIMLCLVIAAAVFCSSAAAEGDGGNDLSAAFRGEGMPRLVPYFSPNQMPPVEMEEGSRLVSFLGLSPDGKTILCMMATTTEIDVPQEDSAEKSEDTEKVRVSTSELTGRKKQSGNTGNRKTTKTLYQPCMIRDGIVIPIRLNAERGDGDPHGMLEKDMGYISNWGVSGTDGLSWSSDGRFVTFSDLVRTWSGNQHMDVPVADTAAGEAWLAQSYVNNFLIEGGGTVYISRMDRNGDYVYYLAREHDDQDGAAYHFCRTTPEGKDREILYRVFPVPGWGFELLSSSRMTEAADGSWLLTCIDGTGREKTDEHLLVRLAPSGGEWTAEKYPTGIAKGMSVMQFEYSAASGYGLMIMRNINTMAADQALLMESPSGIIAIANGVTDRMGLVRWLPGEPMACDTWYMRRTGEGPADVEMVSGEEYRRYAWGLFADRENLPEMPEDFDEKEAMVNPVPMISGICLSPDGRYALMDVCFRDWERGTHRLYLLDVETMDVRPVEAPEGTASNLLIANSAVADQHFRQGMIWNPDGTILINTQYAGIQFFRMEVR